MVIIEASKLPIAEPINRPQKTSLLFAFRWRIVSRVAFFPDRMDGRQPLKNLFPSGLRDKFLIIVKASHKKSLGFNILDDHLHARWFQSKVRGHGPRKKVRIHSKSPRPQTQNQSA